MKENLVLMSVFLICVVSCSVLQAKVGPKAATAINQYCLQPQANRLLLRQEVNSLIAPNSVQINCEVDANPGLVH